MEINKEKLEKLLIANWTEFIDPRQMLATIQASGKTKMTISRFQLTNSGFVIWLDFANDKTAGTSEFHLTWDGNIQHIKRC